MKKSELLDEILDLRANIDELHDSYHNYVLDFGVALAEALTALAKEHNDLMDVCEKMAEQLDE